MFGRSSDPYACLDSPREQVEKLQSEVRKRELSSTIPNREEVIHDEDSLLSDDKVERIIHHEAYKKYVSVFNLHIKQGNFGMKQNTYAGWLKAAPSISMRTELRLVPGLAFLSPM